MMKRSIAVRIFCTAVLTAAAVAPSLAGDLNPPGGPIAPTGPRVISSLPYTITEPGVYVLTGNLTAPAGENGVVIGASGVTVDLRGFALQGAGIAGVAITLVPLTGGDGIVEHRGVTIMNGSLLGWADAGVQLGFAGPDADDAVFFSSGKFLDLHIQGPGVFGIENAPLVNNFTAIANIFDRCTVNGTSSTGMAVGFSAIVNDCVVTECGVGIVAGESLIKSCYVAFNTGVGISNNVGTVERCIAVRNGTFGFSIFQTLLRDSTTKLNGSGALQNLGGNLSVNNLFK